MKTIFNTALLLLLPFIARSQQSIPDSLRRILQKATSDSARHNASYNLYLYYIEANRDSALLYVGIRLTLARKNKIALAEAAALTSKAYQYNAVGKYSEAFQNLMQALSIAEDPKTKEVEGWKVTQYTMAGVNKQIVLSTIHHVLGGLMRNAVNYEEEIRQLKQALQIAVQINHPDRQMTSNMNLGSAYLKLGQQDSALYYAKVAQVLSNNPLAQGYIGNNMLTLGDIFLAKGEIDKAKTTYYEGLNSSNRQNNQADVANLNHRLLRIYLREKNRDSTLSYALKNLQTIKSVVGVGYREIDIGVGYEDLYLAYQLNEQLDSAYKYQGLALVTKDSLYKVRIRNLADFQKISLGETLRLENLEKEKIQTQSKITAYAMLSGIAVLSIIGFILYRNDRQKQKANKVLETTLRNLKSTQSQLIQSEKMASLGELTAGIAHEIQNPLNFVNNFSEVNKELLEELKGQRSKVKGERNEQVETELLNDIEENEEKINHHGKRADAIVKGMLQHSRSGSMQKELTDINALADEYLRLAYHAFQAGMRAKDKSSNAVPIAIGIKTDLDPDLPLVDVVPQEFGRVLLNLINNGFQAIDEKAKKGVQGYKPELVVSTRLDYHFIQIIIADNGPGIPNEIKDKIFQPFFTTKPTGSGTGLGLSLSYDIIKAHGGEIKVKSKENEGTEFIIQLPIAS